LNARSAPASVSSALASRAASMKRFDCSGSSGLRRLFSIVIWPVRVCFSGINAILAIGASPISADALFKSSVLQSYYFAVLVALCAGPMWGFGAAFSFFENISIRSVPHVAKFISLFFSLPCLKASYFFFQRAYAIQQFRLTLLGNQCALLGGKDLSKQFPERVPEFDEVAGLNQFLQCLSRRVQGGHDGI
jgi:hypothetical protein